MRDMLMDLGLVLVGFAAGVMATLIIVANLR